MGDLWWWCRVTQLLERLNRVVEEGNLFDPARPSLGSELEALRQHLEALRLGPDTWESRLDRPTGAPGQSGQGLCGEEGLETQGLVSPGFKPQLGHSCPRTCVWASV